jgi:4-hydroxy-tetrahydrodipicolinate synthase
MMDLEGIIPATVTPMTPDAEVDFEQLDGYIDWLLSFKGLKGFAVNMDTGEGPHLTDEERGAIVRRFKERTAGGIPIFAGLSARHDREAAAQAKMYRDAGADGLVVFPIPVYAGAMLDPRIPVAYHEAVARASGLPMILFQLQPALSGVIFTEETLLRLVKIPEAVALKEASFDAVTFVNTAVILRRAERQITLLTGNDNFIYESFVLGARGALIGFGTLAVSEQIVMHHAAMSGDLARAAAIWEKIRPLEETVFAQPVRDYRARTKTALVELGVICSTTMRAPLIEVSDGERVKVRDALAQAGQL